MDEELRESLQENLVRPSEIAERIGVRRSAIPNYKRRYPDFPKPVAGSENGGTYWWPEVKEWLDAKGLPAKAGRRKIPSVVYVVSHWYDHDGSTPIKAFRDEGMADEFAKREESRLDARSVRNGYEGFSVDELELD